MQLMIFIANLGSQFNHSLHNTTKIYCMLSKHIIQS